MVACSLLLVPYLADTTTFASPVTLTWTPPAESDIVGYKVYQYFTFNTVPLVTTVTSNSFTTAPLNMNTEYTFNVSTLTSTDESVQSASINFKTNASQLVPKPPTNITLH